MLRASYVRCSRKLSKYSGGNRAKEEEVPVPLLQGLRRVRERLGVSVRELSAKSGVSADSISNFEELRRMASLRTARRLAEALGVREEDLR